jgi:hypothetical protein
MTRRQVTIRSMMFVIAVVAVLLAVMPTVAPAIFGLFRHAAQVAILLAPITASLVLALILTATGVGWSWMRGDTLAQLDLRERFERAFLI